MAFACLLISVPVKETLLVGRHIARIDDDRRLGRCADWQLSGSPQRIVPHPARNYQKLRPGTMMVNTMGRRW
jgi:hypothetical protein